MYIFVQVLFNTQPSKGIDRERQREEQTGNNKCSEMKPTNSTETSSKLFKDKLVVEVYQNRGKKNSTRTQNNSKRSDKAKRTTEREKRRERL